MESENGKNYKGFPLDLLRAPLELKERGLPAAEILQKKTEITEILSDYGIVVKEITVNPGPSVSLFSVKIPSTTRLSAVTELKKDPPIELLDSRILVDAKKGIISIEIPNEHFEPVLMREALESEEFIKANYALPCVLGKSIGDYFVYDLAKMPHVLIGGAAGQGKSTLLHSIIISLLYSKSPAELKFVLIDPKKVEFAFYNLIEKQYLAELPGVEDAIITDIRETSEALIVLGDEMNARYDLLKDADCRNIIEYNGKYNSGKLSSAQGHRYLPYIVVIIDEFADIIVTKGRGFEAPVALLAQLARAVGIHLVMATQRPSVNIITGYIKANFSARIAFKVASKTDSRTILDFDGAQDLLGAGDMLFCNGNEIFRIQGVDISENEIAAVVDYLSGHGDPQQ